MIKPNKDGEREVDWELTGKVALEGNYKLQEKLRKLEKENRKLKEENEKLKSDLGNLECEFGFECDECEYWKREVKKHRPNLIKEEYIFNLGDYDYMILTSTTPQLQITKKNNNGASTFTIDGFTAAGKSFSSEQMEKSPGGERHKVKDDCLTYVHQSKEVKPAKVYKKK